MRLLLDTHVFLWLIADSRRLPGNWREVFKDASNQLYLSAVSIWESLIKQRAGKLQLPEAPAAYLIEQRNRHLIVPLPIAESSVARLMALPQVHRDPFDCMLVCQAIEHNLTMATVDPAFFHF
jgi:PIN domain nuclease of toxin-antitoxin system